MRILLFVLLLALAAAAEPLQLEFTGLTVRLYPDFLYWDDGKYQITYDFPKCRAYSVNEAGVDDSSLYARIGGRELEFENRLALRGALGAANISEPSFAVPQLENLFSLRDPKSKTKLAYDGLKVKSGKSVFLEASKDGLKVDPETNRLYLRFLRYYAGGHPDALAWLGKRGQIPRQLTITTLNMKDKRVVNLTLLKTSPAPAAVVPTGLPPTPDTSFGKLLARAETLNVPADYGLADAARYFAEKKYLLAILKYFDNSLSVGVPLAPEVGANKEVFSKDPDVSKLFAALGSSDEKGLQALEPAAGELAYILQLFRGGLLMEKDPQSAYKLYLQVLEAQPRLAGAWRDLGTIYYQSYEAVEAWRCWDMARHLAPKHEMLGDVDALQARLRKTYPEFF